MRRPKNWNKSSSYIWHLFSSVRSKMKIFQIVVAFSHYLNFTSLGCFHFLPNPLDFRYCLVLLRYYLKSGGTYFDFRNRQKNTFITILFEDCSVKHLFCNLWIGPQGPTFTCQPDDSYFVIWGPKINRY